MKRIEFPRELMDASHELWDIIGTFIDVEVVLPPQRSVGGIIIPDSDVRNHGCCIGRVIKITGEAFTYTDGSRKANAENVEVGDYVVFTKYAGQLDEDTAKGEKTLYRTINDHDVRKVLKREVVEQFLRDNPKE